MASIPKIILSNPHIHMESGVLNRCVDYRLTEAVEEIDTGMVGIAPAETLTNADVLELLKVLAVEDINSRQNTYTFALDDVISWECSL